MHYQGSVQLYLDDQSHPHFGFPTNQRRVVQILKESVRYLIPKIGFTGISIKIPLTMLSPSLVPCNMMVLNIFWTSICFPNINSLIQAECRSRSLDRRRRCTNFRNKPIISRSCGKAPSDNATSRMNGTRTSSGTSTLLRRNFTNSLPSGWPVAAAREMWKIEVAFACKISLGDPVSIKLIKPKLFITKTEYL